MRTASVVGLAALAAFVFAAPTVESRGMQRVPSAHRARDVALAQDHRRHQGRRTLRRRAEQQGGSNSTESDDGSCDGSDSSDSSDGGDDSGSTDTQASTSLNNKGSQKQGTSDSNKSSSSSGSSSSGDASLPSAIQGTVEGKGTFFYQGGAAGSCGTYSQDSDKVVAVKEGVMTDSLCGRMVSITNTDNQKTVQAKILDTCPGCSSQGSLDLSKAAFDAIGPESQGVLNIEWHVI